MEDTAYFLPARMEDQLCTAYPSAWDGWEQEVAKGWVLNQEGTYG
jgi:hypothetical protein